MHVYVADRSFTIVAHASTGGGDMMIYNDKYLREVDSGVSSLEFSVHYPVGEKLRYKEIFSPGSYLLVYDPETSDPLKKKGLYTITEYHSDSAETSITVYGEDGGLELINEVLEPYEATEAHTIDWYISQALSGTGFTIGSNNFGTDIALQLNLENEQTVKERVDEIARAFGAELAYDFTINRMAVTGFKLNIYEHIGDADAVQHLRVGKNISSLREEILFSDLATAYICYGGSESGEDPITLQGYTYDDGDFYVYKKVLYCRSALAKWGRYNPATGQQVTTLSGHIVKKFEFDTLIQSKLCEEAIKELKKHTELVTTYEADIYYLPTTVHIGDSVIIDDDEEGIHLDARIISMEASSYAGTREITLEVIGG